MTVILMTSCANNNSLLFTERVITDRKGRPWLKTKKEGICANKILPCRLGSPRLLLVQNFIMIGVF